MCITCIYFEVLKQENSTSDILTTWLGGLKNIIPAVVENIPGRMVLGCCFTANLTLTVFLQSNGNDISRAPAGLRKKRNYRVFQSEL